MQNLIQIAECLPSMDTSEKAQLGNRSHSIMHIADSIRQSPEFTPMEKELFKNCRNSIQIMTEFSHQPEIIAEELMQSFPRSGRVLTYNSTKLSEDENFVSKYDKNIELLEIENGCIFTYPIKLTDEQIAKKLVGVKGKNIRELERRFHANISIRMATDEKNKLKRPVVVIKANDIYHANIVMQEILKLLEQVCHYFSNVSSGNHYGNSKCDINEMKKLYFSIQTRTDQLNSQLQAVRNIEEDIKALYFKVNSNIEQIKSQFFTLNKEIDMLTHMLEV